MQLTLRLIALAFVALFAMGVWFLIASYVATTLPSANAQEVKVQWAISGSVGSIAAAAIASPFSVILFARRLPGRVVFPFACGGNVANISRLEPGLTGCSIRPPTASAERQCYAS